MVIYIDLIFIFTFIFNCLSLIIIQKIFEDKVYYIRIIISSIIGSIFIFSYFISYICVLILKILGGVIIILIAYKNIYLPRQLIKISSFYALNFAFVGFLCSFKINYQHLIFFICGLLLVLLILILNSNKKYFLYKNEFKYEVIVEFDKKIKLNSIVDTCNECFCDLVPVIFINDKYKDIFVIKDMEKYEYKKIDIEGVNGKNKVSIYKPKEFIIIFNKNKVTKNVYVAFCNITHECLLSPVILM